MPGVPAGTADGPAAPGLAPPCRPLRVDAQRNRERVLQAAREVFATRGLDATLDDIARHAGVGTGTVYRRFADREALVEALFEERLAAEVELAQVCRHDPDAWRGLVTFVRTTCAELAADRGMRQVLFGSSYGKERLAGARECLVPLIEELVSRAQDAGALREGVGASDVPVLLVMLGTVAEFAGALAPDAWERWCTVLLDGLRAHDGQTALPVGPLCEVQLEGAMAGWRPRSG